MAKTFTKIIIAISISMLVFGFLFVLIEYKTNKNTIMPIQTEIIYQAGSEPEKIVIYETKESTSQINLCDVYTENYPTYFLIKETQCGLAGGNFECGFNKVGCYDIGTWDNSLCSGNAQVELLKGSCLALGGKFTCTATEVSCERS